MIFLVSRAIILTALLVGIIVIGTVAPAWAAQLDARINPDNPSSPFKMSYLKTIFIEYPNGGNLFDELRGKQWTVSGTAGLSDPGVKELLAKLNQKIISDGSQARISDLNVSYDFHLKARSINTSVDYRIILEGDLSNYVITQDSQRTLIDFGWRGLSADSEIVIDGVEINIPISILKDQEPDAYTFLAGTEAEDILSAPLINADFILQQPMKNWHFLFDPTGVSVDAGTFGLDDSISGFVVSSWTMGESSLREGRQVERVFEAEIMSDQTYVVRSVQSADAATLSTIGFGALDIIDGVEIAGVTPTPPEGYTTTSTGKFPVTIIYGMAGMAALGGIGFFIYSSRSLKNVTQGQQGIDPNRLVGYQTSASAGGYQTNRGEAQLRDDSDYQQTRSVYDGTQQQSSPSTQVETTPQTPPPQAATPVDEDAACGCAASVEMGSECDCEMQGSCLCDGTCKCNAEICKEQVHAMS
jgi:hypothetical protein